MIGRASVAGLALSIGLAVPFGGAAMAADDGGRAPQKSEQVAVKREDDGREVAAVEDREPGDDTGTRASRNSRSRKSRDRTNSRYTRVSRDRDRSRGDLTRDRTRDGRGGLKRDWSRNHTNDRSRNDTR